MEYHYALAIISILEIKDLITLQEAINIRAVIRKMLFDKDQATESKIIEH
jgi:hypothetical protein